jgi:hypothetical protein
MDALEGLSGDEDDSSSAGGSGSDAGSDEEGGGSGKKQKGADGSAVPAKKKQVGYRCMLRDGTHALYTPGERRMWRVRCSLVV